MIPAINNYAYLLSLRLIKQVETKSYKVKLLSWNKMSYKPISYHLYLCWQTTSGNIFIWAQLNNVASTVITVDLRVWRKRICTKMNCFVSLPYTRAVHGV